MKVEIFRRTVKDRKRGNSYELQYSSGGYKIKNTGDTSNYFMTVLGNIFY